jgi:hypothetical protein
MRLLKKIAFGNDLSAIFASGPAIYFHLPKKKSSAGHNIANEGFTFNDSTPYGAISA